jgi:molybdenum cofactor cytidylyltransferase
MKAQTVDVRESKGRVLYCTIFRPGGRKLLSKGHVLSEEDVGLLATEGLGHIWVTELEDGEVGEDDAVKRVALEMGCGCLDVRLAPGGRANLFASENCCVLVDDELLRQTNVTSTIAIATSVNFSYAPASQRIATVKSAPFAVAQGQLEALISVLQERGPILQARAIRKPSVAVLYTDPVHGDRARLFFESVMAQRLGRFGVSVDFALAVPEEEGAISRALRHLLRARPTLILVASTTVPSGPEDVIGRALTGIDCRLERFLAPVDPGNLLLLSYKDDVPIVSAPGCFRSTNPSAVDLILPPMLARYRISGWEVAGLGHGGLLG